MKEREREGEREREKERERVQGRANASKARDSLYVCVRERVRVSVREGARESERKCVRACGSEKDKILTWDCPPRIVFVAPASTLGLKWEKVCERE